MAVQKAQIPFWDAIAKLLTSGATVEEVLAYHPPQSVQRRVRLLLERSNAGILTPEEDRELDRYVQAEHLMRLVKARLRRRAAS